MNLSSRNERRRHPRNVVAARMRVTHRLYGSYEGHSRDISDGGLYLTATTLPPVMPGATVQLQMLDSANPGIVFNARVARGESRGLALELTDYELGGNAYPLEALREQWHVVKQLVSESIPRLP